MSRFPRAYRQALEQKDHANVDLAIRRAGVREETKTHAGATLPGDARKLRGLPAVAPGVSGAIPGTSPHNHDW